MYRERIFSDVKSLPRRRKAPSAGGGLSGFRGFYDRWATLYDGIYGRSLAKGRAAAVAAIDGGTGKRVLEVGIGTGISLPLYHADARVIGVDPCHAMLARADDRVRRLGLGQVGLASMDGGNLGFADGVFDIVVAMHVLSVAADPVGLVSEMRRVCAPRGEIVILNRLSDKPPARWAEAATGRLGFRLSLSAAALAPLDGFARLEWRRISRVTGVYLLRFRNQR